MACAGSCGMDSTNPGAGIATRNRTGYAFLRLRELLHPTLATRIGQYALGENPILASHTDASILRVCLDGPRWFELRGNSQNLAVAALAEAYKAIASGALVRLLMAMSRAVSHRSIMADCTTTSARM
ncbi:hypothetical protein SAMN05216338_10833 [Bradyrhizobium sp. Rc2d]|nr:hypothetical protein SAMN05216338_10833 [Bradyrhizobium sp. Rc2d]